MWEMEVIGEPASKSNSRRVVMIKGKTRVIKSKKALDYSRVFASQVRNYLPEKPLDCLLKAEVEIFYASRRPDLDPSLIFDLLQKEGVIKNDRQIREIHSKWRLDRENPRSKIILTQLPEDYGLQY